MKQRWPKAIQNINQKSINYSNTNTNGETQILTNQVNNKFHVMDIKFLRVTGKKWEKMQLELYVSSSCNTKFVNGVRRERYNFLIMQNKRIAQGYEEGIQN